MMRRRFYGEAPLEAYPLVAPIHEDGTYLTQDEIATQLGSVNIIDKYNESVLPNKKYAYTINNSLTTFKTPNIDGDFWYHETIGGVEQKIKYTKNITVTPTNGSIDRYIIACGNMIQAECKNFGEWLFCGKCISIACQSEIGIYNEDLKCVFHNRISQLPSNAMYRCTNLEGKATIPNGVTSLNKTFYNSKVIIIDLPRTLTDVAISTDTFGSVQKIIMRSSCHVNFGSYRILKEIELLEDSVSTYYFDENNVLYYNDGVKYECNYCSTDIVTENLIIEDCKEIAAYAFYGCKNITGTLTIPNSVEFIGSNAFNGCSGITGDLFLPENDKYKTLETNTCYNMYSVESIHIPDNVTSIGTTATYGMSKVKEIRFHKGIISLGERLFNLMKSLSDIYMEWETEDTILDINNSSKYPFATTPTLHIPKGTKELYSSKGYGIIPNGRFKDIIDDITE